GEPYQRAFHIVKETLPGAGGHTAAGDEHIIETRARKFGEQEAGGLAHSPFVAVALDGAADALCGGEAGADELAIVAARPGLDHHRALRARRRLGAGQEVGAFLEAFDGEG